MSSLAMHGLNVQLGCPVRAISCDDVNQDFWMASDVPVCANVFYKHERFFLLISNGSSLASLNCERKFLRTFHSFRQVKCTVGLVEIGRIPATVETEKSFQYLYAATQSAACYRTCSTSMLCIIGHWENTHSVIPSAELGKFGACIIEHMR